MSVDLSKQSYFEIFSLQESCEPDLARLDVVYQELQARYHPDRVVNGSDAERRQALQLTSILNEAYDTLKSPLKRFAYLLQLQGLDPEEHNQAHLGPEFLLEQMQLREKLENVVDADDLDALDLMKVEVTTQQRQHHEDFRLAYEAGNYTEAKPLYNRLQFLYKLLAEINQAEEKLLDY